MDTESDWITFDDDEEVLWTDAPHPYSLVPSFIVGVSLSLVPVGIPLLVGSYLSHKNADYVATSDTLYRKMDVLSRNAQCIGFDKMRDAPYSQTFLSGQLGYSSVDISIANGSGIGMSFQNAADPQPFQMLVNERIKRRSGPETDAEGKVTVLDGILTELRTIRQAADGEVDVAGGGAGDNATDRASDESDTVPDPDTAGDDAFKPSDFGFGAITDER